MKIEPKIIDEKGLTLLGCVFYGDPFHSAKEWTIENEIGKLWQRFGILSHKYSFLFAKICSNPGVAYEIHIESDDYKKTRKYNVFVGMEINEMEKTPLEMFIKVLPKTRYAIFTTKVHNHSDADYVYSEWIPNSDYKQAYPFVIQRYDERFKGMDDKESELDWYIPVKKKNGD